MQLEIISSSSLKLKGQTSGTSIQKSLSLHEPLHTVNESIDNRFSPIYTFSEDKHIDQIEITEISEPRDFLKPSLADTYR